MVAPRWYADGSVCLRGSQRESRRRQSYSGFATIIRLTLPGDQSILSAPWTFSAGFSLAPTLSLLSNGTRWRSLPLESVIDVLREVFVTRSRKSRGVSLCFGEVR